MSFSVGVDGTGPFSYQWLFNGTNLPNYVITTVAGNGSTIYAGDGGAATNASLNYPGAWLSDASGNLYIADSANNRIRKVNTNGIITTVAGNGSAGYAGDGGAATNASLNYPAAWPSMPPATCTSLTHDNNAFAKWTPTASSPPWRAMARSWLFR